MQLFRDLDIFLFVRIDWLNWIGHVNRIDVNRRVVKFLKTILKEAD